MEFTTRHYFGIGVALLLLIIAVIFFKDSRFFFFILGIVGIVAALPFFTAFLVGIGREREKEEMFLEFSRDLAEGVAAGIPIPKSVLNVSDKDYGSLAVHVRKLANQISLGIPFRRALLTFAEDSKNKVLRRSISIIIEAEESGGEIGSTLDSVAKSVSEVEDIKKERRSIMYNQVVQGYMIFLMFIVIMIILQIWLLPKIQEVSALSTGSGFVTSTPPDVQFLNNTLFILILIQSLFTGLVIGQLSEGKITHGIRHSVILVVVGYLLVTAANAFKGS